MTLETSIRVFSWDMLMIELKEQRSKVVVSGRWIMMCFSTIRIGLGLLDGDVELTVPKTAFMLALWGSAVVGTADFSRVIP